MPKTRFLMWKFRMEKLSILYCLLLLKENTKLLQLFIHIEEGGITCRATAEEIFSWVAYLHTSLRRTSNVIIRNPMRNTSDWYRIEWDYCFSGIFSSESWPFHNILCGIETKKNFVCEYNIHNAMKVNAWYVLTRPNVMN